MISLVSNSQSTISKVDLAPPNQATKDPERLASTKVSNTLSQAGQCSSQLEKIESSVTATKPAKAKLDVGIVASDLWSAAYREAVDSLQDEIDVTILMGNNVAQLFQKLEEIEKDVTQESAFVRGVKFLHSIQNPLAKFKLALDLASPLAQLNPVATTVVGVLQAVTAVSHYLLNFLHVSNWRLLHGDTDLPRRSLLALQLPMWNLGNRLPKC